MSGASKTNSKLVLYAEGADPEADLVLVCGEMPRIVRQQWEAKVKEGVLQLKGLHVSTTMALFQRVAMMMCEKERGAMNRAIHVLSTT